MLSPSADEREFPHVFNKILVRLHAEIFAVNVHRRAAVDRRDAGPPVGAGDFHLLADGRPAHIVIVIDGKAFPIEDDGDDAPVVRLPVPERAADIGMLRAGLRAEDRDFVASILIQEEGQELVDLKLHARREQQDGRDVFPGPDGVLELLPRVLYGNLSAVIIEKLRLRLLHQQERIILALQCEAVFHFVPVRGHADDLDSGQRTPHCLNPRGKRFTIGVGAAEEQQFVPFARILGQALDFLDIGRELVGVVRNQRSLQHAKSRSCRNVKINLIYII